MARITIDVDLPPEVEITGYQRYQDGHGLEGAVALARTMPL